MFVNQRLGIGRMEYFRNGMIAKLGWKILKYPENLGVQVVSGIKQGDSVAWMEIYLFGTECCS